MKLNIKALCQSTAGVAKLRSKSKFYSSSPTRDGSPYTIKHITSMLFVCGFTSHSRIFHTWRRHHYRWSATNFDLSLALMAIQRATPMWHRATVYNGHLPKTRNTHICCQVFGSGPVTTCFYDFGLSWLGFEHHTFCMQGPCSSRLHHCDGWTLWVTH